MQDKPIAGRYDLVEPINSGGMGQVWRGYDSVLDREVAIKLIRPDVITTDAMADEFAKRFQREARITARIQHHGVPQVYDAVLDRDFDQVYLVMELVHGTPLRQFIDPGRPLPIAWAAATAAQICTVLSHAHAIPAVHRDLKPDNILICPDGAVKVLDFGIAALLRPGATKITGPADMIGTRLYMSPEQIQTGRVSPHTDLYALGCILHEMLTGTRLFDGETDYELYQQHVNAPPRPAREIRPDVPDDLEALVLHLLAKAPHDRPADAYDVYERLLPFLPLPGAPALSSAPLLGGMPDPTLLYRRPNPPRPRIDTLREPATPSGAQAIPADTRLQNEVKAAVAHADHLLDEERFRQAAEVLRAVIDHAAQALDPDHRQLLGLRSRRAAILMLAGDFRRALPEFDSLRAAYFRLEGPDSPHALECLQQAAHCHAELGHTTDALRQFQQALDQVRKTDGDANPDALELRRLIALLLAEREPDQAISQLHDLHQDLLLVLGPDDPATQEIAAILARLR